MITVKETSHPTVCRQILLHPDVLMAQPGYSTLKEAEMAADIVLANGARVFAVSKDGQPAGGILLFPVTHDGTGWDLHFCIVGVKGIAAEATLEVYGTLPPKSWLQCQVHQGNIRVNKVLDKIGFSKVAFPTWGQSGLKVRHFHSC